MKTIVQKTKEFLFDTRKRFYRNRRNIRKNVSIDLGARKLFFSQTFDDNRCFIDEALRPHNGINVAVYVQSPQILIDQSKNELVLDTAVCYRLDLSKYKSPLKRNTEVVVRKIMIGDIDGVNEIYRQYGMFPVNRETVKNNRCFPAATYFVAENKKRIVGIVIGVNHVVLFNSPEGGSSLWGLAVLPGSEGAGIGTLLINYIAEHYQTKGLDYTDLYVDYYNKRAISLYEKAGFRKIPRFCLLPKSDLLKPCIQR
jgi:ribosomal protein S18 acetylase RimI-like enzyme